VSSNNQPAYWYSTNLGTAFPRWKNPGEIAPRAHCLLPRDFLGRNLSESLRNAPIKTKYTPSFCRTIQDQSLYHDSFLPYEFPQKLIVMCMKDFRAAFSTSLNLSSTFGSCVSSLIWGTTSTPSSINYRGKLVLQIHKSNVVLIHCFGKIFYESYFDVHLR
jgi:hypothetical protein